VPVLLLVSAVMGNAPFQHLLDERIYSRVTVYRGGVFFDPRGSRCRRIGWSSTPLGDADPFAGAALKSAMAIVAHTNGAGRQRHLRAVLMTGRADNAARLSDIPGLITPATVSVSKDSLSNSNAHSVICRLWDLLIPFCLRSPGFHIGRLFQLHCQLRAISPPRSATLPGHEPRVDPLSGHARRGRKNPESSGVMIIDGKLYPAHLARLASVGRCTTSAPTHGGQR